jgi:predicted dehydrogenase
MSMRVAFIGAGEAGRAHLATVSGIDDVHICAVADIDRDRAAALAAECGAKAYERCSEILESEKPDAVYVCVPPAMHGTIEIQLADAGVPFFVEKPINLDLSVASQVEQMVAEQDLTTSVGYQFRYSDAVQAARDFLSNRQPVLAQGFYVGSMPEKPWWRNKTLSGGQVVEQASHVFDLLRYLVGEVETVCAFATTGAMLDVPEYSVEDASVAALEFSGGSIAQVATSCVLNGGGKPRVGIRFDGRSFTVQLDPQALSISDSQGSRDEVFHATPELWSARADRAFIEAVRTGDRSGILCDYSDALHTLDLVLSVDRSLTERQPTSPSRLLMRASH